ncbi:MAG: hypothetical protein K5695_10370 [Oscillospiraceae bacterium]|nr:hypothetical protein [Oscillospiraceae bacterium]
MKRETFRSNPFRGFPMGLVRGFLIGCVILLVAVVLGMEQELFIPLLVAAGVIGGVIGIICGIGKIIEADENGIYLKNKEYLFAELDMSMQVHTHYYHCIPVTERWINITGNDGKQKVKCTFLNRQDAGRLAKIIEDGMRKKYRTIYDGLEQKDADAADVQMFTIPATELAETIDKRNRLLTKTMFWFLTVLFSWILISMILQDQLEEHGLMLMIYMASVVLLLGGVNFFICRRFKKAAQKIPCEIVFSGGSMYIDGVAFAGMDVTRVVMTPERGAGTGDMRKLVLNERNEHTTEYSFGFRADRTGFPGYGQLVEAVKAEFGDQFAYDMN